MECMKCGRSIEPGTVFCDKCLEGMEKYPVTPGTPINLPRRKSTTIKKANSRRRSLSHEELVAVQRRTIRHLWLTLICVLLCLVAAIVMMLHFAQNQEIHNNIGQNYSTRSTDNP